MRRERDEDVDTESDGGSKFISVNTHTLDDLCKKYEIDDPEFIKIDIEGGEIEALRGGGQVLDETRRVMVEAYYGHPDPDSPDRVCAPDVYQILHRHGRVDDGGYSVRPCRGVPYGRSRGRFPRLRI